MLNKGVLQRPKPQTWQKDSTLYHPHMRVPYKLRAFVLQEEQQIDAKFLAKNDYIDVTDLDISSRSGLS